MKNAPFQFLMMTKRDGFPPRLEWHLVLRVLCHLVLMLFQSHFSGLTSVQATEAPRPLRDGVTARDPYWSPLTSNAEWPAWPGLMDEANIGRQFPLCRLASASLNALTGACC